MSTAIDVRNLSKKFPSLRRAAGIKEWIVNFSFSHRRAENTFIALHSVNFSVEKGECIGIIGKNGAGKSTLLSLLLGTSFPTSGEINVSGKRTPLLELGAGFHPDLTGKENVILNGVLLGLTRKVVLARLDDIVRFSEIEPFIEMPVRTYSSGMYLRLAFSVAIHTEPQTLLIDELLAVGDESFQKKSGEALLSLIKSGVTTVLVSHDLQAVKKICHRVIWLDQGEIRLQGKPEIVIDQYLKSLKE